MLGVLRAMSNDPEAAVTLFERALEIEPHSLMARENLAGMLCQLGRLEEGVEHYQQALAVRDDAGTRVLLASALLALERPKEARAQAAQAAQLAPRDPAPWDLMAECAKQLGNEGDAASCRQEAQQRRSQAPR